MTILDKIKNIMEVSSDLFQDPDLYKNINPHYEAIKIALDDFGTGYSSLNYLETLPIDLLKIDKSFIDRIKDVDQDEKILTVIIQLAHILGLEVVAEGVETKDQMAFLNKHNCNLGQGYLFSKPLPAEEFEALLGINKK